MLRNRATETLGRRKKPSFEVPILGMLPDRSGQAESAKKLGFYLRFAPSFYVSLLNSGSYRLPCLTRPHIVNFLPVGETEKGVFNHTGPKSPPG